MVHAIRIHAYGDANVLKLEEIEAPVAGPGQVLIDVKAMGVNPIDWKLRSGMLKARFDIPFPAILGCDIAGTIAAVGDDVEGFRIGDPVYAMVGQRGAYAEKVAVDASAVAHKPESIDFVQAAAVPLVALTAWMAVVELGIVKSGDRVLVHAAAGGVGSFAVQIAKAKDAYVIGTASAGNAEYLLGIGCDEVIDYRNEKFEDRAGTVDLVIDMMGGEMGERSLAILKKGGRLSSVTRPADPEKVAAAGVENPAVFARPNGEVLAEIARMIDAGKITVEVAAVFPFADVGLAHQASEAGHVRGKLVVEV